jgi:copper chaperone NosL
MRSMRNSCLALVLAALAACAGGDKPAEPVWGKAPCAHCGMIVGDRRFAAQLVTEDGERLFFDDVGCMLDAEAEGRVRAPVRHRWVRVAEGEGGWIPAESARYRGGFRTPMDSGFGAVAVAEAGDLDWAAMRAEHARGRDHQ